MSSGEQSRQWLWQGKSFSFKKLETTLALSLWGEKLKMSTLVLNMSDFQQTSLRDSWNLTVSHLVCRGRWRLQALRWWMVSVGGRGSASGGGGAAGTVLSPSAFLLPTSHPSPHPCSSTCPHPRCAIDSPPKVCSPLLPLYSVPSPADGWRESGSNRVHPGRPVCA